MAGRDDHDARDYSPAVEREIPSGLAGLRLDQALARMFPEHSRNRIQHLSLIHISEPTRH